MREPDGSVGGVLCIVSETTERVRAQRDLARQKAAVEDANRRLTAESAFLEHLFEEAPSFMALLVEPDHKFRLANAAYRRLVGPRELIGKPIREALPEIAEQGFFELLDEVWATGKAIKRDASSVLILRQPGAPPEERILEFIYQPLLGADGNISGIFVEGQDVTDRVRSEKHLRLVINELNHRVKNTLAMMQAVAAQTFRNAEDLEQAQQKFSGRIMALSRANDLLTGERWVGASLRGVVDRTIEGYCTDEDGRCEVEGSAVTLSPKTALSVSMALHELATNAVKYGAWSTPEGRVEIRWRVDPGDAGDRLHLEWRERGGPPVVPPKRRGFGSRLIERGLAAELGGEVRMRFDPEGLVCVVDAPLTLESEG